jgi:hypothetical protein
MYKLEAKNINSQEEICPICNEIVKITQNYMVIFGQYYHKKHSIRDILKKAQEFKDYNKKMEQIEKKCNICDRKRDCISAIDIEYYFGVGKGFPCCDFNEITWSLFNFSSKCYSCNKIIPEEDLIFIRKYWAKESIFPLCFQCYRFIMEVKKNIKSLEDHGDHYSYIQLIYSNYSKNCKKYRKEFVIIADKYINLIRVLGL